MQIIINKIPSVHKENDITTGIKPIDREEANVEVEKGELVLKPDLSAIYKVHGKPHTKGGTPANLEAGSFIFSHDKTLALNKYDHELLELKKGGTFKASKNTPAEVLKRNIDVKHYNKMSSFVQNPYRDDLSKTTAMLMLGKYHESIGKIATIQEEKKNFPEGLPQFAEGTAPVYDDSVKEDITQQTQYMKRGGSVLDKYQLAGEYHGDGSKYKVEEFDYNKKVIKKEKFGDGSVKWRYDDGSYSHFYPNGMVKHTKDKNATEVSYKKVGEPNPYIKKVAKMSPEGLKNSGYKPLSGWNSNPRESQVSQENLTSGKYNPYAYGFNSNQRNPQISPERLRQLGYDHTDSGFDYYNAVINQEDPVIENTPVSKSSPKKEDESKVDNTTTSSNFPMGNPRLKNIPFTPPKGWRELQDKTYKQWSEGRGTPKKEAMTNPNVASITGEEEAAQGFDLGLNWMDKANIANAMYNALNINRYMPMRSQIRTSPVRLDRLDPQAAVNQANEAMYNAIATNRGINPYLAAAQNASIYGRNLGAINQIRSQYDQQNLGIGNQEAQMNAQIAQQDAIRNAGFDQQYYRETVEGAKNFDNARATARNSIFDITGNAYEKSLQAAAMNMQLGDESPYLYDYKNMRVIPNPKRSIMNAKGKASNNPYLEKLVGLAENPATPANVKQSIYAKLLTLYDKEKKGGKFNPYR